MINSVDVDGDRFIDLQVFIEFNTKDLYKVLRRLEECSIRDCRKFGVNFNGGGRCRWPFRWQGGVDGNKMIE
ncbi:hypothetical protein Hanom_Chr11g00989411 [Helianthus anomalus]